jgi:septum site-determining protein MinC
MAGTLVQGAVFTVMVVRATMLRDSVFADELARQIELSPRFFLNAPVVLDLRNTDGFAEEEEFAAARNILRHYTLMLVGVQNALPAQVAAAAACGLATFAPNALQPNRRPPPEPRAAAAPPAVTPAPVAPAPVAPAPVAPAAVAPIAVAPAARARLVTQPVRSGTQIYARGGDLVITATVSPGAEIAADGNIHVYGALRGRALAGAGGDREARIFCSRFEAELVSIAGRYLVSEQLPPEQHGLAVQIALVEDALTITRN